MASHLIAGMIARYKGQKGVSSLSNNNLQHDLGAVGNIDLSNMTMNVGDTIVIPALDELEEGQVMKRDLNGRDVYFIVTDTKVLYFSTLRKSVVRWHKDNNDELVQDDATGTDVGGNDFYDDGHTVHSKGAIYDAVMAAPTLYDVLKVICGHTLKVTSVTPAIPTARYAYTEQGAVPVALRTTTIPHFEYAD